MLNFLEQAKKRVRRIVFPESSEPRTLKAVCELYEKKIVHPVLLTTAEELKKNLHQLKLPPFPIETISLAETSLIDKLSLQLFERRKLKRITVEDAKKKIVSDPLYFGATLVDSSLVDGMVAGAIHETRSVIKSAIYCIGSEPNVETVSSFFIMVVPNSSYGENGLFFFADCGVNPNPNSQELSDICFSTVKSFKKLFPTIKPRVALLSFSTKGSAHHTDVSKVTKAVEIIKELNPDFEIDGELQGDAALIDEIRKRKAPQSSLSKSANILIFPTLDAGNIAYKLVERLAEANAYGPILQGFRKPINDLSRGCSSEDIIQVAAITSLLS